MMVLPESGGLQPPSPPGSYAYAASYGIPYCQTVSRRGSWMSWHCVWLAGSTFLRLNRPISKIKGDIRLVPIGSLGLEESALAIYDHDHLYIGYY